MNSDKSYTLNYDETDVNASHSGNYVCAATNAHGSTEAIIKITVKMQKLNVEIPHPTYTVTTNQLQHSIECNISPKAKLNQTKVAWLFNGTEIDLSNPSDYQVFGLYCFE